MRKVLLSVLSFLLLMMTSFGQDNSDRGFIEIGDGTTGTTDPLYVNWNYAWGSFLYTADQIGETLVIDKIAFFAYKDFGGYQKSFENQKVYFKMTPNSSISMAYPDPEMNGYTKVWEGTIDYPANGAEWMVIDIEDFAYDGTSNLILHWQNHSGTSYSTSGLFYGTEAIGMQAVSGNDESFPETQGGWAPYKDCNPNMRIYHTTPGPCTPEAVLPANNDIKVDLNTDISFSICDATSYDFYLGTNEDNLVKMAADVAVSADGDYSYTHTSLLEQKTTYFYKIVAKDGTYETVSPIYKFQTQTLIEELPFICDFEDYYVSVYTAETLSYVINTNWPDSSDYSYDSGWMAVTGLNTYKGLMSARVSAWHPGDYSLTTPRVRLPDNSTISFYWRNNYFFDKEEDTKNSKEIITTYFEVTTDGGVNWTEIASLTPSGDMTEYEYVSYDVSQYKGDNVYFRWRYHEVIDYNAEYFWIDDIKIAVKSDDPVMELELDSYDYPEICAGAESSFKIIIRNIGASDLNVNMGSSDGPFESDYVGTITSGGSDTATVYFKPTEANTYNSTFKFTSNSVNGNDEIAITGISYNPYLEFFEGFDLSDDLPEKWGYIKSPWDEYSGVSVVSGGYEVFSNPNAAKILKLNDSISPVMLITPGVSGFDVKELVFWAKKAYDDYDLNLEVGVISNPEDASTFVAQETIELTSEFTQYTVLFKANNTIPYIAFKHASETPYTSLRIDNIGWGGEEIPNCPENAGPADEASAVNIMMNPVLDWADGGGGTEGYKLFVGTDNPPTNMVNNMDFSAFDTEYELTQELDFNTKYYWQVIAYNSKGDCTENGDHADDNHIWSFTTMSDPTVTTLPFTENFNSLVNNVGVKDVPLGWSYEDYHGDNVTWDVLMNNASFPGMVLGDAAMHVPFHMVNEKDDYLYTPPISLEAGKSYELKFMLHTIEDMVLGQVFNEEIEVKIGTDNSSGALLEDAIVYANVNTEDWKEVTVQFTVDADDDYYVAFHAISEAAFYLLILDDVELKLGENSVPEFTSTEVTDGKVDELYTYNIEATDADGDDITITATEKPEWLTLTDNGNGTAVLTGTPTAAGDYNVKLSANDGALSSVQEFVIDVLPVGINTNSERVLTIFPNPNNGQFYVEIENEITTGDLVIVDVDGRVVYQAQVNSSLVIDVQQLSSGFYQVLLPTTNGLIKQKLVIE